MHIWVYIFAFMQGPPLRDKKTLIVFKLYAAMRESAIPQSLLFVAFIKNNCKNILFSLYFILTFSDGIK